MSKQADQTITMLCIIRGSMEVMIAEKAFSKIDLKIAIADVNEKANAAVDRWPIRKNWEWIQAKFKKFTKVVNPPDRTDEYKPIEVTMIAERLAIDLQDMYPVGLRGELVKPILSGIKILLNHMDPDGQNFPAMEAAGKNMDKLYEILEIN